MSEVEREIAEEKESQLRSSLLVGEALTAMRKSDGWQMLEREINEQVSGWKDQLCNETDEKKSLIIRGMVKAYNGILGRVASALEDYAEAKKIMDGRN